MSEENDTQEIVLEAIRTDPLAVELKLALFSAALLSYRKDSCLRPFPDFLQDDSTESPGEKNMEQLQSMLESVPSLQDVKSQKNILSEQTWKLLHWIVTDRPYSLKSCEPNVISELLEKTGEASFSVSPDHVFEVNYHNNASQTFDARADEYGVKLGYHGSRMDNFYSIVSNGLQVHLMKNGVFGDGIYLTEDLAVTMPYVQSGAVWKNSSLGTKASCVAVCEILNHPGVKCQVENDKTRSQASGSEQGEVPSKYFVVTSSDLVRIKYLFIFLDKKRPALRRRRGGNWIFCRYPVASVLFVYCLFLLLMGLWKSRTVQMFWRQRQRTNDPDFD